MTLLGAHTGTHARLRCLALVLAMATGLAAPAWADEDELVWDPWEPMNRAIFGFNEWADHWVLEPVAKGYDFVMPERAQKSVENFFENLEFPVRLANDLFQLKIVKAFEDTGRFLTNSTVGVAGLFDVASAGGFPRHDEDFGQTLGYWGVPTGPYFVIPLLGPSNVRDAAGQLTDTGMKPLGYFIPFYVSSGLFVADKLNDRSIALEALAAERAAAFDFYVAARGAYSQFRENQVLDRKDAPADEISEEDADDLYYFEEEDFEYDEEEDEEF